MSSQHRNRPRSIDNKAVYPRRAAAFGLFLLSAVGMAFEVILTHLFSVVFQYHFAFLAVSTAILGLGIGAVLGYRLRLPERDRLPVWLSQVSAVLALIIPLVVILFSLTGFVPGYLWQIVLGACPFILVGLMTSHLYELFDQDAAWLYAFDLIGAALGLVGVLFLMDQMSPPSVGFVLGVLAAAAGLVFSLGNRPVIWFPLGALGLAALGLAANLLTGWFNLPRITASTVPPDKTMFQVLTRPGSKAQVIDSAWSSFARVDLVAGAEPDQMYAFTNAGAGSYMIRFNGDLGQLDWLKSQVEYLPFHNFIPQKTLILGAGAGKDVLQALLAGSAQVHAVEINPAMVAITRRHADFNGGIFDYPGVTTVVADGRDYLQRTSDLYDMIYLNLVYSQAPAPGSNALSEAYMFTVPAFQQYWRHLAPGGRLAIISHQGLEGARALITAIKALNLEGLGAEEILQHAALLRYNASDPNQATTVMILQKTPLTAAQATTLQQAGSAAGMTPLFLPGIFEALFSGLVDGKINLDEFLLQQDYNLFPTTDESPFFFNLNPGLPQPLVILLVIAGTGLVVYLLFMLGTRSRPSVAQLVFFGGLGMGYFLVEVPLIQRMMLLVGSPTLAMVVVLVTLMVSGGLGSYLSSRFDTGGLWLKLSVIALLVALLAAGLAILQPRLISALEPLPQSARILLGGLSLVPLGLLMGVPFANGMRMVGATSPHRLPYLWGWNAVTSVAGSALVASLSIWSGFGVGILLGSACYLVVAGVALVQARRA